MDPLGAEVGTFDPILITPDPYGDVHGDTPMFMDGGDPFHLSDGCGDIDGMPASYSEINERIKSGSAVYDSEEWGRTSDGKGGLRNYVIHATPMFDQTQSNMNVLDAVWVPDYNDSTRDHTNNEGAWVGVISGRFVSTGGHSFNTSLTPQNPYPGFDKEKLAIIDKALREGAKLLSKSACQKGLAKAGINVQDLTKRFNALKARPDTAQNTKGYNVFYTETNTDAQIQQIMQTEKVKNSGAYVLGQDVMVRDNFFRARGGAKISADPSRALALIHEAVHITGPGDAFFGGSSKLNDIVIKACWSSFYGHNDLAIVGD